MRSGDCAAQSFRALRASKALPCHFPASLSSTSQIPPPSDLAVAPPQRGEVWRHQNMLDESKRDSGQRGQGCVRSLRSTASKCFLHARTTIFGNAPRECILALPHRCQRSRARRAGARGAARQAELEVKRMYQSSGPKRHRVLLLLSFVCCWDFR